MLEIPEITITKLLFALAFVVPGIIATKVFHLKCPGEGNSIKEFIFEIFAFSAVNFVLTFPLLAKVVQSQNIKACWLIVVFCFFIAPVLEAVFLFLALGSVDIH